MKRSLSLEILNVQSFVTSLDENEANIIKGGLATQFRTCTDYIGCSDPAYCATGDCPETRPIGLCTGHPIYC